MTTITLAHLNDQDVDTLRRWGVELTHVLVPYIQDNSVIQFINRLNDIIPALRDGFVSFSQHLTSLCTRGINLNTLFSTLLTNLPGVVQDLAWAWNYTEGASTQTIGIREIVMRYVEGFNHLIRTVPRNGVITPLHLLRFNDYSSYLMTNTVALDSALQRMFNLVNRAIECFSEAMLLYSTGNLFGFPVMGANYRQIGADLMDWLTACYPVQDALFSVRLLVVDFAMLLIRFIGGKHSPPQ